jgi:hypothetical protein
MTLSDVSRRFVLTAVALLGIGALMPADAATFGRTTVGTTATDGLLMDFKQGSKFTLTEPGTITSLHAYIDGQAAESEWGGQWFRMALYQDAGGAPGVKVLETHELRVGALSSGHWAFFDTPAVPLEPGDYWIAVHSGGGGPIGRLFYDGAANWFGNEDGYGDGSDAPFGAGSTGQGTLSLYATYTPASELKHFGRTSIANMPSDGLTANAKRGSRFTLSEAGTLQNLYAYLDGFGGATAPPPQQLRMALYRDSGGVPGLKVTESAVRDIYYSTANWYEFPTPLVALTPGAYWIVIHSGEQAGRARNYEDGAANWYGNADAFSDGAADAFGPGDSGTVTLSVYGNYTPQ